MGLAVRLCSCSFPTLVTFILLSSRVLSTSYSHSYHYTFPQLTPIAIHNAELHLDISLDLGSFLLTINNTNRIHLLNSTSFSSIISTISLHSLLTKRRLQEFEYYDYVPPVRHGIRKGRFWKNANQYCKYTRRGHLATVHEWEDNEEVAFWCNKFGEEWHCWIGLRRPFTHWVDGSEADYPPMWMMGQPNNFNGNEDCVALYSEEQGEWADLDCHTMLSFVCEKPAASPPTQRRRLWAFDYASNDGTGQGAAAGASGGEDRQHLHRQYVDSSEERQKMEDAQDDKQRMDEEVAAMENRMHRKEQEYESLSRAQKLSDERELLWAARLRHLRRMKQDQMEHELEDEHEHEKNRDAGFALLNNLIGSSFGQTRGAMVAQPVKTQRRLVDSVGDEMIARCLVVGMEESGGAYEICVNWNVGAQFVSVDVRVLEGQAEDEVDGVQYFEEYEYYFTALQAGNESIECVDVGLMCRVCLEYGSGGESVLIVREVGSDGEYGKEEELRFEEDSVWDEVVDVDAFMDVTSVKKCSSKLSFGTLCVEEFDSEDHRVAIRIPST